MCQPRPSAFQCSATMNSVTLPSLTVGMTAPSAPHMTFGASVVIEPSWLFAGRGGRRCGESRLFSPMIRSTRKSFVHDIGAEANAEAIVKAIIALGRSLGKSVTAEGVETELQLAFLRRHTCDEAQGYLLARPTPATEVERAFTSHAALSR